MSKNKSAIEPVFTTEVLLPRVQRIGGRDIEITYLGYNLHGEATWILWNVREPNLIGMLRQGPLGITFEQTTSAGAMVHKGLTRDGVRAMLEA